MDIAIYPKLSIHKLMCAPGATSLQIKAIDGPEFLACKADPLQLMEKGAIVSAVQGAKEPIFTVKASDKLASAANQFDVFDYSSNMKIGTVKRDRWKPFQKSIWYLTDPQGTQIGVIEETNAFVAFLHQLHIFKIIPKAYKVQLGNECVAKFRCMPLIDVLWLDFSEDRNARLDRRLGIAAGLVICIASSGITVPI